MIPVAGLIDVLPSATVTVEVPNASTVDAYGRTTTTANNSQVTAVVHPATAKMLERLPEADRARGGIAVYTKTAIPLRAVVQYGGDRWRVVEANDYGAIGGMHFALATRIEVTA